MRRPSLLVLAFGSGLVTAWLSLAPAFAQEVADGSAGEDDTDEVAEALLDGLTIAQRLSFGFNSSHGNVDALGVNLGLDLGRARGHWQTQLDLDGSMLRQSAGESESILEEVRGELAIRRDVGHSWHAIGELEGKHDSRSNVESDATANLGAGARWAIGKAMMVVEAGAGYGWESIPGSPTVGSRHLWLQQQWIGSWKRGIQLTQRMQSEFDLEETRNVQLQLSLDLTAPLTARLSLQATLRAGYDALPQPGIDELDLATTTGISIVLGRVPASDGTPGQ